MPRSEKDGSNFASRRQNSVPPSMTQRQIASAVRNGQMISFHAFDVDELISGYVAGEDPECYFVLQPVHQHGFRRRLVRKSTNPLIDIHDASTYRHEESYEAMEEIIRHYRIWLINNVLAQIPPHTKERRSHYDSEKAS